MHGGGVRADSEGLGHGTAFTFSLPLCRRTPEQPLRGEATEEKLLPSQCRVLLADDNRDVPRAYS